VLVADQEAGGAVKGHLALVVEGVERVEVLFRHRKEGHVLDVRIVLHVVAGEVMDVVSALQWKHGEIQTGCDYGYDMLLQWFRPEGEIHQGASSERWGKIFLIWVESMCRTN
jgi:hypothetical protein